MIGAESDRTARATEDFIDRLADRDDVGVQVTEEAAADVEEAVQGRLQDDTGLVVVMRLIQDRLDHLIVRDGERPPCANDDDVGAGEAFEESQRSVETRDVGIPASGENEGAAAHESAPSVYRAWEIRHRNAEPDLADLEVSATG